jgi:NhaP-type Na+/H+ or K+/H+ antiporter
VPLLLIFALLLFSGVLISRRARESVLSTSVLFLLTALLLGGFSSVQPPGRTLLYRLAEIALYSVLFSDGMKTGGLSMLRSRWWPVARTLLIGMPLTIALLAVLARLLLGIGWRSSAALGAALSPTDPVFVAAIFAVEAVPSRVKETLTIESGFNDGLALPAVFLLVPRMMGNTGAGGVIVSLLEGLALGVAIPWVAIKIEELPFFGAAGVYERLHPFAIGLILYGTCSVLNANLFLAAFTAGLTIATIRPLMQEAFEDFASPVTELLKLGTILIFALRVGRLVFTLHSWQVYLLVVLSAFVVRMAAVPVALLWSRVSIRERLLIGWFGPKGFASVVYGLMLLEVGSPELNRTATVIALTIVLSIFGYSSTDVLLGRWLKGRTNTQQDPLAPEQRAGGQRS